MTTQYNPKEQTLSHLACMADKGNITYGEFCQMLAKSGEVMDKEITLYEEGLITEIVRFSSEFNERACYLIDGYNVNRPDNLCIKHMVVGVIGEVGELLDAAKNVIIYRRSITDIKDGKRFDNNFQEELGDIMFFLTELYRVYLTYNPSTQSYNYFCGKLEKIIMIYNELFKGQIRPLTLQMCVEDNVIKLSKRYHKLSYSNEQATERKDKQD